MRLRSLEDDRLISMATMATKADLQAVRNDLHVWVVGVCLTILLFVVGFGLTLINIALQILSRLPTP